MPNDSSDSIFNEILKLERRIADLKVKYETAKTLEQTQVTGVALELIGLQYKNHMRNFTS